MRQLIELGQEHLFENWPAPGQSSCISLSLQQQPHECGMQVRKMRAVNSIASYHLSKAHEVSAQVTVMTGKSRW